MDSATRIGIIGAGAWGTALGVVANRAGSRVTLWTRNANVIDSIRARRFNEAYLPEVFLDPSIEVTDDLHTTCKADFLILCLPSHHIRPICISIADMIDQTMPVMIATKGVERGSLALMSEVVHAILPDNPIAVLSGPNFAGEAAHGSPTATTIACANDKIANTILYALGGKYFRPYITDDLVGAQIGGAVKNVIAIACGIATGRGFGENARAALITRGLAEMSRMNVAKGGREQTLMGLSGLGDLVLTCSSPKSRNMALGIEIGKGVSPKELVAGKFKGLAEGVFSSESVTELAKKLGVSMPICKAVRQILLEEVDIDITIQSLMERPFVSESQQTSV